MPVGQVHPSWKDWGIQGARSLLQTSQGVMQKAGQLGALTVAYGASQLTGAQASDFASCNPKTFDTNSCFFTTGFGGAALLLGAGAVVFVSILGTAICCKARCQAMDSYDDDPESGKHEAEAPVVRADGYQGIPEEQAEEGPTSNELFMAYRKEIDERVHSTETPYERYVRLHPVVVKDLDTISREIDLSLESDAKVIYTVKERAALVKGGYIELGHLS